MLLHEAITSYLTISRSVHTQRAYARLLAEMEAFLGSDRELQAITTPDLLRFFEGKRPGLKPSSEACYTVAIKTFFNWCDELSLIPFSPARRIKVRVPKSPPPASRAMPEQVLKDLYEKLECRSKRATLRDRAIVAFLDDTACRRGAVANLTLSNLRLADRVAYSVEKGGELKPLEFSDYAAEALAAWLEVRPKVRHDYVFTKVHKGSKFNPLKPDAISTLIRRHSEKVGPRAYGPHSIRRAVAQDFYEHDEADLVIRDKLNHKQFSTTEKHYIHQSRRGVKGATERRNARRKASRGPTSPKIIFVDFEDKNSASMS